MPPMEETYTALVDSLVRLGEGKVRSSRIVKQLQAFLNVTFDESIKRKLKRLSRNLTEQYNEELKHNEELRKIAVAKQCESMHFLIEKKLKTKAWLDLLYTQNMSRADPTPVAEKHSDRPEANLAPDLPSDAMTPAKLYRQNLTLLFRLNHDLNPHLFAPKKEVYRARRQLEAKRKKSRMKYDTFEDSIYTTQISPSQHLYTWSESIHDLTNIKEPLTMNEVIYLVFRYARENKLFRKSLFYSNEHTSFLLSNDEPVDSKSLFQKVISHKILRVGHVAQDGVRYNNSAKSDNSSATCIIPTDAYNVPGELLQKHFESVSANTDIQSSFSTLFKSKASKSSNR